MIQHAERKLNAHGWLYHMLARRNKTVAAAALANDLEFGPVTLQRNRRGSGKHG